MKNIHIETGLFKNPQKIIDAILHLNASCTHFLIISDTKVAKIYAEPLKNAFLNTEIRCDLLTFPHGEKNKTRKTKEQLEDSMLALKVGSDSSIIAIGGGVTTDLVGFIAATYARGIPLISIPTSLLAMVDASLGGKNGVNTPYGKNSIGSFCEPKKILIDPETLSTLNVHEIKQGLVEIIKHATILSPELFSYLETKNLNTLDMEKLINENCRIKTDLVEESKKNKTSRNLLNFGHTVGHALELVTDHSLSHGHAVAIGMIIESAIAVKLGIMEKSTFNRIKDLILRYEIPILLQNVCVDNILEAMCLDKKSVGGLPRFVMVKEIGFCLDCDMHYCMHVDESVIRNALESYAI